MRSVQPLLTPMSPPTLAHTSASRRWHGSADRHTRRLNILCNNNNNNDNNNKVNYFVTSLAYIILLYTCNKVQSFENEGVIFCELMFSVIIFGHRLIVYSTRVNNVSMSWQRAALQPIETPFFATSSTPTNRNAPN